MGPWNENRGPWNVIMGPRNVIGGFVQFDHVTVQCDKGNA